MRCQAIAVAALFLAAAGASAQGTDPYDAPREVPIERDGSDELSGFYVGLGGTFSLENFDLPSRFETDNSAGLNARIGYQSNETLAAELVFDWVAPYDVRLLGNKVGDVEMALIAFNLKFLLADGPIEPFVQAGIGLLIVERNFPGFHRTNLPAAGRFGGGVDFHLGRRVVVSAEAAYVPPFGDATSELDFVLFGGHLRLLF